MSKKRISLRLDEGEIAVVGPIERWKHLVMLYERMAEVEYPEYPTTEANYKQGWLNAANWIRQSIQKTEESDWEE